MPPEPPVAKRIPSKAERHGETVVDDWAWLADRDDPDTLDYLRAENAHTDAWFGADDRRGALVDAIFGEIKRRTQETDLTVPVRKGEWWYLTRTLEGLNYPIHVRRPSAEEGDERVLLDENLEAGDHPYFALGAFDVSPSGRFLIWSRDTDGDERYQLRVRDLDTGDDLADVLEGTYYGTAWLLDEEHLLYVVPDEAVRPHQVWRHRLGTPQADDVLVHQEDDERFFLGLDLSRSEQVVLITTDSNTTSEVRYLPADRPEAVPVVVEPRRAGHEYSVEHQGDRFVILTNDGAEDFRVVTAPVDSPGAASWTELIAHQSGRRIQGVDAFDGFIVLHEWHEAVPRLRIVFDDGTERIPAFDEAVHAVDLAANPRYSTPSLRFEFESLVTPRSVYEEDVRSGERRLLKQTEVLDGFDRLRYRSARTWAVAADGTRVPLDVVWHRDTPLDSSAAAVVYGYAAYEHSLAPWFSIPRLSLLDRGMVWALAHPRGGGELGRRWYLDGKLANKRNSFTDLIACAEHLTQAGFAAPGRVGVRGGSAGGLLVGAAMTLRPDLFGAVVAEVPFVDVVTTMLDPSLPLTVTEREEWGDPRDPVVAAEMASYAPYENVAEVDYPPLLVTAGLQDPRVSYHEPAKWVAKLRALATGDQPILLRTELSAGHGGPSGRYDAWQEEARTLAFLLTVLGVAEPAVGGAVSEDIVLGIAGHEVKVTSPAKVFFPAIGATKLDLVQYYLAVAEPLLRAGRGRPALLQRFPEGATGKSFFQKRVPAGAPSWLQTTEVATPNGTTSNALVLADMAHAIWAVNLACLGFHLWPYQAGDPDHVNELRIDLDPQPGLTFDDVRRAAALTKELLDELGLDGRPKTTGSRGLHVYVRLQPAWDAIQVRAAAVAVARELERRHPTLLTAAWWKEERGQRVFIDFNQNAPHKTVFGAWSARSRTGGQVSTPFAWDELAAVEPDALTILTVPERVARLGDPWASMDDHPQSLEPLLELVEQDRARGLHDAPWPPVYPKMPDEPPRVAPSRAKKEAEG